MQEPWASALSDDASSDYSDNLPAPSAYPSLSLAPLASYEDHVEALAKGFDVPRSIARAFAFVVGLRGVHARIAAEPERLEAYLRSGARAEGYFAMVQSATVVLAEERAEEPRPLDIDYALDRAARLVAAAHGVRSDFESGRLSAERYGAHDAEMFQFWNLFGTALAPGAGGGLRRVRSTSPLPYAAVLLRGSVSCLALVTPSGAPSSVRSLREGLERIVAARRGDAPGDTSPFLLSASHPRHLPDALRVLAEAAPDHLRAVRNAEFVVCLDLDEAPASPLECGRIIQTGAPENRWYLAATNLVISGNGRAGVLFSYGLGIDGNVMSRFATELARRAGTSAPSTDAAEAGVFPFLLPVLHPGGARWMRALDRAKRTIATYRRTALHDLRIGIGRNALRAAGVAPVAAFTVALQAAVLEQVGDVPEVAQAVSQNRFRWGTVWVAPLTTPQSRTLCRVLLECRRGGRAPSQREYELYSSAERESERITRNARGSSYLSNPAVFGGTGRLMAAYLTTIFPLQATRSLYHRARRIFARGKSFVRSLPVMTSHPPFADEWTIFGRPGARSPGNALWLHFQVKDDHSTLVVAPPVSGAVDETRLVADLEFHLAQLASLAERCAPAAEPAAAG